MEQESQMEFHHLPEEADCSWEYCVKRRARRGSRVDPNSETTESVHQETLE